MATVEKFSLEDGRRAERRVQETDNGSGESVKVVELHVEEAMPLRLEQRVVEKRKPIVYEREIETIDRDGNVIEKKVESVEPRVPLRLVDHIGVNSVSAQSVVEEKDCDCNVTREEMVELVIEAIKASKGSTSQVASSGIVDEIKKRVDDNSGLTLKSKIIVGVVVAEIVAIAYLLLYY